MTAKHRAGSVPVEHDVRLTDPTVALACAGLLPIEAGWRVIEGSAGDGAFVRAVKIIEPTAEVHANELRASCKPRLVEAMHDMPRGSQDGHLYGDDRGFNDPISIGRFESYLQRGGGFDLSIGNPPYSRAEKHVRHSLYLLNPGGLCAYLLGVTFRGSQRRRALFHDARFGLWRKYLLEERPSFSGDGATDATEYALFIFRKGWTGDCVERSFAWKDPKRYAMDRQSIARWDWPDHALAAAGGALDPLPFEHIRAVTA